MDVTSNIRKFDQLRNLDAVEDEEAVDAGDLTSIQNIASGRQNRDLVDGEICGDDLVNMDNQMDQEEYLFIDSDKNAIGGIEDISDSQKGFEKYEIQSVLKRPNESNENRSESQNFTEIAGSKSRSERQQLSPQQRKSSAMRRGAGTGAGYGRVRQGRDDEPSESKNTSMKYRKNQEDDDKLSDSYYDQSQSQLTSQRSHFTSIEGPPKIYEEVMRQLEADIRKHIRIEHQLKLHIESVEDRVEELEREQEDFEDKINELQPYKQEVLSLKKELKSKEEVLDVKQILLEKQKTEIEELQKNNKKLQDEVQELRDAITRLEQDNQNLAKDLKVSKSQNQRDKDKLQRLVNQRQGTKTTQQFHGPYESYLEDKCVADLEMGECGISGTSGQSGVSGISGKSDLNAATMSMFKQANSMQQQLNNSYDRLSFSENRTTNNQNVQELQFNAANNINQPIQIANVGGQIVVNSNSEHDPNLIDVRSAVHEGFQSMNHKNNKGPQLKNGESNSGISGNGSQCRSGKSNSESRQRGTGKAGGAGYGLHAQASDSSRMKQMSQKQFMSQTSQQIYGGKFNKGQKQFNQSLNVLGNGAGGRGQVNSSSSAGGHQNVSTSKSRRGNKQSKHSSLEKFNTAMLYGTQNIPKVHQQLYLGGGLAGGHATQQLTGPQLQIKMQSATQNPSMKKGNKAYNVINVNSFTPDRLKSRQAIGIIQQEQALDAQNSVILKGTQGFLVDPTGSLEIAQATALDVNDIQKTFSMTQDLNDLNATQQSQSRSQSQLTQYNPSIGSNVKMSQQIQNALQTKNGASKKQNNMVGMISLAGMNATLQAAHNSTQKLTSKAQLQNIYNTGASSSHQKQHFRGNKNQHPVNPASAMTSSNPVNVNKKYAQNQMKQYQIQNSRNGGGLKGNYKTMGTQQEGDAAHSQSQLQQLRFSSNNNLQQKSMEDKNANGQSDQTKLMQNSRVNANSSVKSQKSQKSSSINKQNKNPVQLPKSQLNVHAKQAIAQKQQEFLKDASNGLTNNLNSNVLGNGPQPGVDTSSTGATGGTVGANGSGPTQAQRRCSSQLQNRQQTAGVKSSKDLHKRDQSNRALKNQSQNSNRASAQNHRTANNKSSMRTTIAGSKPAAFPNSNTISQSLNNTQKMRKGDANNSTKRPGSSKKAENQPPVVGQLSSMFNSNHQLLVGNQQANYEQIQNILKAKNQNMQGDARVEQQKTLSASSSNRALSSLNNTLNNYQMINYNQQSQKAIMNPGYLFATQQNASIPQKRRVIPARDGNSQSALSLTQQPDQAQTHTQSTNQKEAAQDEFNREAVAEKDRYKQANQSSKFKHPVAMNAHQGLARIRNSSYNNRQGENSASSGPRIYSANNFLKN